MDDGEDNKGSGEEPVTVGSTLHLETSVSKNRTPNSWKSPGITMLHLEEAKTQIRSPAAASLRQGRMQLC